LLFRDEPPAVLYEDEQRVESLRRERERLVAARERAVVGVEQERPEAVDAALARVRSFADGAGGARHTFPRLCASV
jgi:hypothetical protein